MSYSTQQTDPSAFNFAAEYLKHISRTLYLCQLAAIRMDMQLWVSSLRTIYRQLSCKTSKTEDEEFNAEFKKIYTMINNPRDRRQKRGQIFSDLDTLEITIRKKLQEKGMLLPSKNDPGFAVGRR